VVSGNPAAAGLGVLTSIGLVAVAGCTMVVLHSPRGRARLQPVTTWLLRLSQPWYAGRRVIRARSRQARWTGWDRSGSAGRRSLLLVWSAGAAAASFSPTPYGLGVVEIALIVALRGAGLRSPDAVGAVLLYRVITFKIAVTLVWIGYRHLRARFWAPAPSGTKT
jgi:hypothetical protein